MDALLKLFDPYNRKARLSPALLAVLPLALTAMLLREGSVDNYAAEGALLLLASSGGAFFLAHLSRSRGKALEGVLLKEWGGWPSTILLRHLDETIDAYTKARYHAALEALTGLPMPTKAEEASKPRDCDARYRAATTKLIEMRRDEKYSLLHQENAGYGFRRNLLGLKPLALFLLGLTIIAVAVIWYSTIPSVSIPALKDDIAVRWHLYAALILNVAIAALWITVTTKTFVRQAGDEYAMALLRTLDANT